MGIRFQPPGSIGSDSGVQHRSTCIGAAGFEALAGSAVGQGSYSRLVGALCSDPQHAPKLGIQSCLSPPAGSTARLGEACAHPTVSDSASQPGTEVLGGPPGSNTRLTADAGPPGILLHPSQNPLSSPAGSGSRTLAGLRCQARRRSLGRRGCQTAAHGQLGVHLPLGDSLQGTGLDGPPKQVAPYHRDPAACYSLI